MLNVALAHHCAALANDEICLLDSTPAVINQHLCTCCNGIYSVDKNYMYIHVGPTQSDCVIKCAREARMFHVGCMSSPHNSVDYGSVIDGIVWV